MSKPQKKITCLTKINMSAIMDFSKFQKDMVHPWNIYKQHTKHHNIPTINFLGIALDTWMD